MADWGTGAVGFGTVAIFGAERNKIINNSYNSSKANVGISIDDFSTTGTSRDSKYNIVKGNTIVGTNTAIGIAGSSYNTVSDNIISTLIAGVSDPVGISLSDGSAGDGSRSPVRSDHNIISGNIIYIGTVTDGISLTSGYHCIITSNKIDGGRYSITLGSGTVQYVKISNNSLTGMTANGILVSGTKIHFSIDNNYINGAVTAGGYNTEGILIESPTTQTLRQGLIQGNTFSDIGLEAIVIKQVTTGGAINNIAVLGNIILSASMTTAATYSGISVEAVNNVSNIHILNNIFYSAANLWKNVWVSNEATLINISGNSGLGGTLDFSNFKINNVNVTSGTLTGATDTIEVNIPAGALIVGLSMNNEAAVTDSAGNDTYTAAFSGGSTVGINAGAAIAAAANTKTKELYDTHAAKMVTTGETDIVLTPNGGNFTSGEVRAIIWYITAEEMPNAS
jgi:parallel beta-helix repeat protein